jgi:hypothetical protein
MTDADAELDALIARNDCFCQECLGDPYTDEIKQAFRENAAALRELRDLCEMREGELGSLSLHIETLQAECARLREERDRAIALATARTDTERYRWWSEYTARAK